MNKQPKRVVRAAAGAGRWFPGKPDDLKAMVDGYLDDAETPEVTGTIVAALSPHAGYVYSGRVAGCTFSAIRKNANQHGPPDTVVVLGFSHRGGFPGVAVMDGDAFETPLGEVTLDQESGAKLVASDPLIRLDHRPHMGEHSAENQVPFLQQALPGVPLVIALLGGHDLAAIDGLLGGLKTLSRDRRILLVASTDMLHDPSYELVRETDEESLKLVEAMDYGAVMRGWSGRQQTFCGVCGVITAMRYATGLGCKNASVLHYRNSGDDFPESRGEWVVGYGSVVFAVE